MEWAVATMKSNHMKSRSVLAAVIVAAIVGALVGHRLLAATSTYRPPNGDRLLLLQRLASAFPAEYGVAWRHYGGMRASDPEAQKYPDILEGAMFSLNGRTASARAQSRVYVEAAYSYFDTDEAATAMSRKFKGEMQLKKPQVHSDEGAYGCRCDAVASQEDTKATDCFAGLRYGNYHVAVLVTYNLDDCTVPTTLERRRRETLKVIERLDQAAYEHLQTLRQTK